ncbi:MAG: hypothetical protein A2418_00245 [Candidatus Brennerbacteria bacterium RIFOXYC1_FULL_41_11]|uniref:DUF5667 domain-containing protein n=1 Tax=Candidatus Brennerbacteria bacterium RIFOXYD1_FULL_41_16 TaxID=1797529 RepID=A0A1G1XL04_9BACT|nr:MAG: hypothetical protein A2391_01705 [Candidatus Brennerbacteria bacterium RIFOXYB1_FULL_41_13]OGY39666.1 MAG: hypothetical protein A2418_00245 [Candidatus Brennerbacteria bacterium RIFOXYC1_FULL_41_11]OGY40290.1 MAG: hypothetical protein A2570_03370 [Candidatus Brennerbacteria bacterium RIFOXYD1_FULL_41_16]
MKKNEEQLILELKQLKGIPADFEYLNGFRHVLTTKMVLASSSQSFMIQAIRFSLSFAGIVISFISLGYVSVVATQNIPVDNILYPARLAGERLQLGIQGFNQESKTDLMLKFAENRLAEIKILEERDFSDNQKLKQLLNDYNLEIAGIQSEILSARRESGAETLAYLLKVESRLSQIAEDLGAIRFDSSDPGEYLETENMLVFMQDFVSRRIFECEQDEHDFSGDGQRWDRVMKEYLRLQSRKEMFANSRIFVSKDVNGFLATFDTKLSGWRESFDQYREIGQDEDLLRFGSLIREIEIEFARFEALES